MNADVTELIMQDHREVERLFEELRTAPEKRAGLVPVLTTLLTAHSRAEESEVYPVAASEAGIADEVQHSQAEHLLADRLLGELRSADPNGDHFEQILGQLVEAINHHVEEEESTVLPGMRQALGASRLDELGQAFLASREAQLGFQPEDISKSELEQQAKNAGIAGLSGMSKEDLAATLQKTAEE